jgi:positive regulator of sigma E activity
MKYLQYTQYVYLLAGLFFIYDGITKLNSGTDMPYISFMLAATSIFMFFFRRKFAKKFEDQNKNQ